MNAERDLHELKQLRSNSKSNLTRKVNQLRELLTADGSSEMVRAVMREIRERFKDFQNAHEICHEQLSPHRSFSHGELLPHPCFLIVNSHSIALFLMMNSHPIALFLMVHSHPIALFLMVNSHPIALSHGEVSPHRSFSW